MWGRRVAIVTMLAACGGGGGGGDDGGGVDAPGGDGAGGPTLSDHYPGDVGIGGDPAVVWFEDFQAGSVVQITSRYDQAQGTAQMQVVPDVPPGSGNAATALAMTAGGATAAV